MSLSILELIQSILSINNNQGQNLEFLLPSILLLYNWNITQNSVLLIFSLLGFISFAITNATVGILVKKVKEEGKSVNENMRSASKFLTGNSNKASNILKVSTLGGLFTMFIALIGISSTLKILIAGNSQSYFTGAVLFALTLFLLVKNFTEAFWNEGYWHFVKNVQKELPGKNFWVDEE